MTRRMFVQDPCGSHVCNRRGQGLKWRFLSGGLAKIQVRDEESLDQSSDAGGDERHSDVSFFLF